jgi:predicted small lipoprotein YifL
MNLKSVILLCIIISLAACGSDEPKKFEQADKNFYPISSFIKAELQLVDSLPLAVFKYTTKDQKSDTQLIAKPDFRKIAESFISPDITQEPLKKLYTESVFMDATINMVTFSYTTEDTAAEIRKIDIFINPETDKVKNIYVERISRGGDSTITQKMIWTTGKNFSVSTIRSLKDQPEQTLQEKYVWDMNQ